MEHTQPSSRRNPERPSEAEWPLSRVLAALVLVPSVPMLLASAAALLLFYMAPVRFGNLISRLPGESLIRTILVFAPATLLAVVVLALLYAVDQGGSEDIIAAERSRSAAARPVKTGGYAPAAIRQTALTLSVIPLGVALLFALAVWSLSFISPGRFDRFIEPFPAERYLRALVPIAPWILFLLVLAVIAAITVQRERLRAQGSSRWMQDLMRGASEWTRWVVSAMLTFALPALGVSILALSLAWLRPERVSLWIERLPFDSLVRIGLLFAPPMLFTVVVLAALYLQAGGAQAPSATRREAPTGQNRQSRSLRSVLATAVLVVGLTFTVSLGFGLLGTVLYLVLR